MLNRLAIWLIRGYQRGASPLLGANCRFEPSCSQYGVEAFQRHNILRAGALTGWRILRCNPFNDGGLDPVAPAGELAEAPLRPRGPQP